VGADLFPFTRGGGGKTLRGRREGGLLIFYLTARSVSWGRRGKREKELAPPRALTYDQLLPTIKGREKGGSKGGKGGRAWRNHCSCCGQRRGKT